MSEKPAFLHKYCDISGLGLGRLRLNLITKQLWLSRPADFNDPFDCAPVIETTWEMEGVRQTVDRVAKRRTRGLPKWERKSEQRKLQRIARRHGLLSRDEAQTVASKTMRQIRESMAVLSLSADPENILMWGHYARSHSGVLLSFRTDQRDIIAEAQEVRYSPDRPVVDLVGDRANTMVKALLHKADCWAYEREWRTIRAGQAGLHPFAPESLIAITFGRSVTADQERVIRQAVGIGGCRPKFARAVLDDRMYRIRIDAC